MKAADLQGIFPPVPTPFENGKLALERLAENIARWNGTGLRGYVIFGSNGESVFLEEEEKLAVVRTVVEAAAPGMAVIAGTGCESTAQTIRLTNACARLGAHAALVVTPFYYGPQMTEEALYRHFTAVADASDIPILVYNVTKFTHLSVSVRLAARLAEHPRIIGIKDSNGNVATLGELIARVDREHFAVLVGTAGALFSALSLGAAGGVLALANVAPEECVAIARHVAGGDRESARRLQLRMLPVNTALTATYGVPGLKAALDLRGYFGGDPRPPLLPSGPEERAAIAAILRRAGLIA